MVLMEEGIISQQEFEVKKAVAWNLKKTHIEIYNYGKE
jgi:hypothetical protein